jgi:hypothetical protein
MVRTCMHVLTPEFYFCFGKTLNCMNTTDFSMETISFIARMFNQMFISEIYLSLGFIIARIHE